MHILLHKRPMFIAIIIISFFFCAAAIIFETNVLKQNQEAFTRSFGNQQELLVSQISRQANNMLTVYSGTEQDVIDEIIKNAETSGSRYWLFVKNNKILFYKNDNETSQLKIINIDKVIQSFKISDGENIDALATLFYQRKNGSVLFSESKAKGLKLASVSFFEVDGATYSIGMCTTENFILDTGGIFKHNSYSLITMVAICLILFSSIVMILIIINKKNEDILILKKIVQAKNLEIEKLTTVGLESDTLYDENTNIYSQKVMDALLRKTNNPKLFPISTIVINMHYSESITYDALVSELAPKLQKLLPNKSIVARTHDNQLTILLFMTEYKLAKDLQLKLIKSCSCILNKFHTSVESDVTTCLFEQDTPIDNFEYENLITSKDNIKERI